MKSLWMLASANDNGQGELITMDEQNAAPTTTQTQENGAPEAANDVPEERPGLDPIMMVLFLVLGIYFFLIVFRGPRKKQQEHKKMVSSLRKNDRVRTVGGIIGTVLDIRDDEIVLKIDESTNTKMRITPSAIATVLSNAEVK